MKMAQKLRPALKSKKTLLKKPKNNVKLVKKKIKKVAEPAETKVESAVKKVAKNKLQSVKKTSKTVLKKKKKQNLEENHEKVKKTTKGKNKMPDIESLKEIDPEFYDFLKANDKELLEFNVFDSDDSEVDEPKNKELSDAETEDEDEKYHIPAEKLEVASDESDFEADEEEYDENTDSLKTQKITLNLLRQWQAQLNAPKVPLDVIRKVVQALNAALASISAGSEEGTTATNAAFKVSGGAVFDGVVSLCVLHLQPAIWRALGVKPHNKQPFHKLKQWVKLRSCLRYYITDLSQMLQQISSPNILSVLLKHLHQMAPVVACFSNLAKVLLKRLITLWATEDETVRIIAFLCILKITRNQQCAMLHHVLKAMYLSYVRNSKFVSPTTLPCINFMRRSLVEMFALDLQVSYHHAFLYIRQLAIHLRNAVVLNKKDSYQAVYNWQYINSLRLWADLLASTSYKPQLQPLVYPLITLIFGAVRLIPTAQYFPLRFHCVQMLVHLAKSTNVYIPLLPVILEVLRSNTFNKKHTNVSMRPMPFTFILRLNKTQLSENGFRDETVEQLFSLTLEYLAHESASLAFSDLVVPIVINLKKYLKECRNANYSRKLKQLVDKIKENSDFINQERTHLNCGLQELPKIQTWETAVRQKGTPLEIYYASWVKMHETKKRRLAAQADKINSDYDLPTINKPSDKQKKGVEIRNENEQLELFPDTDSDDNMPVELVEKLAKKHKHADNNEDDGQTVKRKKIKKKVQKTEEEAEDAAEASADDAAEEIDIVKDLDLDDW